MLILHKVKALKLLSLICLVLLAGGKRSAYVLNASAERKYSITFNTRYSKIPLMQYLGFHQSFPWSNTVIGHGLKVLSVINMSKYSGV